MNIFGYEIVIIKRKTLAAALPELKKRHDVWVLGNLPPKERTIADMLPGEIGYTVPWAWDEAVNQLRTTFTIGSKGGTSSMRVECTGPEQYQIEFEEPIYRNPMTGEYSSGSKGWPR